MFRKIILGSLAVGAAVAGYFLIKEGPSFIKFLDEKGYLEKLKSKE